MALICEICQHEQLISSKYEDSAQLRDHLVEFHSKFVADALLAPNINDKIHIWLMANIDYSSSSKSAVEQCGDEEKCLTQVQEDGGITEHGNDDVNFEMNNNNNESAINDNNGNNAALEMLLKGILDHQQVQAVQPPSAQEEEGLSDEKIGNEQSEQQLDFFDSLKTLLLNSAEIQQKSGESTPSTSRAALVDSKAIRKAHCQVCNLDICSTARQRHVYMIHLKKKDLFKCKLCDYINSNSMWEVQKHCRMQHGSDIKPISQEEKHKLEIQMWSQLCFPEWKQKPQKRKLEEDMHQDDNKIVEIEEKKKRELIEVGKNAKKLMLKEEVEEEEFDRGDPEAIIVDVDNSSGVNDRLCHLCMEESKYPGRHIAQRHLKQPLYECPICFKFGSYESCTVSKHIQKVHPKSKLTPINNLSKYAQEIRDLQIRCFPNRQMKLVRPVNNSGKIRPRERHICGICGTDVAQSDRQRHVFHKHLRKGKIFECPLCDFSSNYDIHRVKWHIKWDHKEFFEQNGGTALEPISHESEHRDEIDALNEKCFPGWQRKRHISSPAAEDSNINVAGTSKNVEATTDGNDGSTTDLELLEKAMKTVAEVIHNQQQRESSSSSSQSPVVVELPQSVNANALALDEWHCQLCRFALKPGTNLLRHIAKDHLNMPLYQCPICENHGAHSAYEVRSHMLRSHGNTKQEPLSSLDENLEEIEKVWHDCFPQKEFKVGMGCVEKVSAEIEVPNSAKPLDEARVRCRECGQEMKTEDRQVHVYRHHLREPRLYECPLCDFSHYACSSDVRNHILRAHKNQSDLMPRANLLRYSKEISEWNERCFPGWINRRLPASLVEDFNSCRLCGMDVKQTSRHIAEHHLCIPLHQCPLCEYGAAEARLVLRHMRNNHTTRECRGLEPISNVEKRRAEFSELHNQCFPGRPKRLSNITIADESRRAKCRGCGMTISKKRRCLHLLEKHLKKQIFKCKYCLFASNHDREAVEAHQKMKHAGKAVNVVSNLYRHKGELRRLAAECFNEPNIKMET